MGSVVFGVPSKLAKIVGRAVIRYELIASFRFYEFVFSSVFPSCSYVQNVPPRVRGDGARLPTWPKLKCRDVHVTAHTRPSFGHGIRVPRIVGCGEGGLSTTLRNRSNAMSRNRTKGQTTGSRYDNLTDDRLLSIMLISIYSPLKLSRFVSYRFVIYIYMFIYFDGVVNGFDRPYYSYILRRVTRYPLFAQSRYNYPKRRN